MVFGLSIKRRKNNELYINRHFLPPSDGGDIAGERSFPIWERNFDCLLSDGLTIGSNGLLPIKDNGIGYYCTKLGDVLILSDS